MLRLFIAVNLPEDIKEKIGAVLDEVKRENPSLGKIVKWTPEENQHFTLIFLGYQPEAVVSLIKEAMTEAKSEFEEAKVEFKRLDYGPIGGLSRPVRSRPPQGGRSHVYGRTASNGASMIWLITTKETEEALAKIKSKLEAKLLEKKIEWRRETRPFRAHLTLARFLPKLLKDMPKIREDLIFDFSVHSLFLMKSTLKPSGAVYETLFQVDF